MTKKIYLFLRFPNKRTGWHDIQGQMRPILVSAELWDYLQVEQFLNSFPVAGHEIVEKVIPMCFDIGYIRCQNILSRTADRTRIRVDSRLIGILGCRNQMTSQNPDTIPRSDLEKGLMKHWIGTTEAKPHPSFAKLLEFFDEIRSAESQSHLELSSISLEQREKFRHRWNDMGLRHIPL